MHKWTTLGLSGFVIILIGAVTAPFIFERNAAAQGMFNVLLTIATTIVSMLASKYYAKSTSQDEITRYGLQAWRRLNSLSIKLEGYKSEIIQGPPNEGEIASRLSDWALDIDDAKLAWQDLLKETFELAERLRDETEELSAKYRTRIEGATDEREREHLEQERQREVSRRIARSPLPVAGPPSQCVRCPRCDTDIHHELPLIAGQTRWPYCVKCNERFPIHRLADMSVIVGGKRGLPHTSETPGNGKAGDSPISRTPAP